MTLLPTTARAGIVKTAARALIPMALLAGLTAACADVNENAFRVTVVESGGVMALDSMGNFEVIVHGGGDTEPFDAALTLDDIYAENAHAESAEDAPGTDLDSPADGSNDRRVKFNWFEAGIEAENGGATICVQLTPDGTGIADEGCDTVTLPDTSGLTDTRPTLKVAPTNTTTTRGKDLRVTLTREGDLTEQSTVNVDLGGQTFTAVFPPGVETKTVFAQTTHGTTAVDGPIFKFDNGRNLRVLNGDVFILANAAPRSTDAWRTPATGSTPAGRFEAAVGYMPITGQTVMFGGSEGPAPTNETWIWDGSAWTQETFDPTFTPPARQHASMAYHEGEDALLLFGGATGATLLNDTWSFDGEMWSRFSPGTPDPFHAGVEPPASADTTMFTDEDGNVVLLTVEETAPGNFESATYRFESVFTGWQKLNIAGPTPARLSAQSASAGGNGGYVFGGFDWSAGGPGAPLQDMWKFADDKWTNVSASYTTNLPPARGEGMMAWDPGENKAVLIGGAADNAFPAALHADAFTWTPDGGWAMLTMSGGPGPRERAVMAFESGGDLLLFGGADFNSTPQTVFGSITYTVGKTRA